MSIFNLISGDPHPVQLNPQSLMDQLFSMSTPAQGSEGSALTPAAPLISAPSDITANPSQISDLWQPTHRNHLGRIADAMLMASGRHPVYEQRMQERDLTSAMEGFDPNNPMSTIKRIAQIPGMADQAYKMYEQYSTDQERNQSRDIRDAAKTDMVYQRLGGMAGAATEKNWPVMKKLMTDYVTRWGLKPEDFNIPDTFDADALDAMSNGAITAKDQQAQTVREEALALRGRAIDNTDEYRQARLGQIDTAEGDRNSRFQQSQSGINTRFTTNQTRLTGKGTHPTVMTKYGPGIMSTDGNQMIVTNPKMGGRQYGYVKAGNNWVPVGETAASKKSHGE